MAKNKIYEMLRDMWIDQGPSAGGWGVNNAYLKDKLSTLDDTTSRPMALNLETGKQTAMKKGGAVKAKPKASSASKRADGCAIRGKTRA